MEAMKIIIALIALRIDGVHGFNGSIAPRGLPSSSPLRVASTARATGNDGVGESSHVSNAPDSHVSTSSNPNYEVEYFLLVLFMN